MLRRSKHTLVGQSVHLKRIRFAHVQEVDIIQVAIVYGSTKLKLGIIFVVDYVDDVSGDGAIVRIFSVQPVEAVVAEKTEVCDFSGN